MHYSFRVIKSSGIKQAVCCSSFHVFQLDTDHASQPKLTIALLDREDLRALAHLMNSYPTVLKEKVLLIVPELK